MYEQELASVMLYVVKHAGNPELYDGIIMQDFKVPSVYFPPPHVKTAGSTLDAYLLTYSWYIKLFHVDASSAYEMGFSVVSALQCDRLLMPLVTMDGRPTGKWMHMHDPLLSMVEGETTNAKGKTARVAQLTLSWDSHRPYNAGDAELVMRYITNLYYKAKG